MFSFGTNILFNYFPIQLPRKHLKSLSEQPQRTL